jgi:hypothetical protein
MPPPPCQMPAPQLLAPTSVVQRVCSWPAVVTAAIQPRQGDTSQCDPKAA